MIYEEPCRLHDLSKFNRSRFWIQKNVDEIMALLPDCNDMQLKVNILPEVEKEMIPTLDNYITIKRESRKRILGDSENPPLTRRKVNLKRPQDEQDGPPSKKINI